MLAELDRADGCADLPQALIHPDFVPANAILTPDGGLVLVDWTGAGRGPRLYPLAFLLWAAGCGGPSRLDAVVAGYREHVTPGDDEIGRLAGAIWARPLILACWMVLAGRKGLAETVAELASRPRARGTFRGPGGRAFRAAPAPGGAPAPPPRAAVSLEGVGGTGLTVAAVRAFETARPDRLFADPLAATFAEAGGLDLDSPPGGRRGVALRVWVVARTLFLDDLLAEAVQQGCRQVVLLGAGFDARAFRLPWPPGTRCFEVDTPDVLGPKDQVLAAEHAVPGCERFVVPCDLRDDWPAALRAAGLDPAQPTAWIAEGLLVYLDRGRRGPAAGHGHRALGPGQLAGPDHDHPGRRRVRRHSAGGVAAVPGPRTTRSAGWPGWAGPRTSRTCARCSASTAAPCLNAGPNGAARTAEPGPGRC